MRRLTGIAGFLFFAALLVASAAARRPQLPNEVAASLASSPWITLYSLQPWGGPDIPQWDFHGHHILGRLDLSPDQAKKAIDALNVALSEGATNVTSACLIEPRHALAFKKGNDAYAILICYKCGQLEVYKNDQQLPFRGIIGGEPDVLNRLLQSAAISLADDSVALQKSYAEEAQVALKLAEEGDPKAQGVMSAMFMRGRGVKKDEAKGADWLRKSMKSSTDDPKFQVALGKMYADDTDQYVTHNYAKALELFQRAAAHGNAEAQYRIGFLYDFGDGAPKSPEEAMKWYRQAAENGYAQAQFTIGVRHASGTDGANKDYAEALLWLRKAADQSHPEAVAWMGTMYDKGWGVPKDKMEAYFWDQLAERYHTMYGNRGISFKATPEQSAVLRKRLADWIATHPEPLLDR